MPTRGDARILFITRRYPPTVGGIQTHCYHLYTRLVKQRAVRLVALRQNALIHLAWFMPYAFFVAFFKVIFRRVEVIYFSDGVVCALATLLRPFTRARFVVTIYGLELTYSNPVFSRLMRWGIARCERVAVISQNTWKVTEKAGVPAEKLRLIYLGVETPPLPDERHRELRAQFEADHDVRFGQDRVLLNIGRQVRRKGLAAFLTYGAPLLDEGIKLFIGGDGPEAPKLRALREELGLQDRVFLLGWLEDDTAAMLRREADLFLMPNIRVPNDVEGYGIAPLECMLDGLPVVAFAVDALVESIREGGYLIPEADYPAFVNQVHRYLALPASERAAFKEAARSYVAGEYSWDKTAEEYLDVFEERS